MLLPSDRAILAIHRDRDGARRRGQKALDHVGSAEGDGLFVLRDFHADQVNVVQVTVGTRKQTLLFAPTDGPKALPAT